MPRARAPACYALEFPVDAACLPALLDVARPALPPVLSDRLDRWDQLDEEERERARGDLRMIAVLMRRAS